MKKSLFFLISFLMIGMALFAQTSITLTFTGRDQHNAHVRLDTVTIQNLTRGWTEAIFFPDTVYTLTVGTGIEDYAQGNEMQVMPNPFNGKTQLNLYSVKGEPARMVIVDITGKKCAEYQGNLSQGDNYFEISLTTPQTYVLSVQTSDGVHSVKMVNTGHAGTNQISLVGGERNVTKVKISSSKSHIFELGDEMRYTGYSQQSNGLIPSAPITQQQSESEVITLNFELNNDAELPIVATVAVSNIGSNTATTGGNVFSDGGATVTARGVCYSVVPNPTLVESHTTDGTGTGAFTSSLTNLVENTTYYVRAYATNSAGTAYGQEVSFTTQTGSSTGQSCPGTPTVTDYDGNIYNTVQIGNQCWMKENLRTTHYANGETIPLGNGMLSETNPYRNIPGDNVNNIPTYGYLYNWIAVMHGDTSTNANPSGVQGICPTGWHVPSDAEWTQLANYVNSQSEFLCGGYNNYIAKALAANFGWNNYNVSNTCAVCNNLSLNNATGFSALPAGVYWDEPWGFGELAGFWSATSWNGYTSAKLRGFCYDDAELSEWPCDAEGDWDESFSVRCIRGIGTSVQIPTVITSAVSSITNSTAVCGGEVIFNGESPVSARGLCWSTSPNPTVADNHTNDGSGGGTFTTNILGLNDITTYYVRAYATNNYGTAYGEERVFVTTNPNDGHACIGNNQVVDYDGNSYQTVQIGSQCWMKENLRTTHYANGDIITTSNSGNHEESLPYYFAPCGDTSNVSMYGYLYNWPAVMHGSNGSNDNPSCILGICPTGWHVPSNEEWLQLKNYVGTRDEYICNSNAFGNTIGKALADTIGWNTSSTPCAIGNNMILNNVTGFSIRPAGDENSSCYNGMGWTACFWTATEFDDSRKRYIRFNYDIPIWNYNGGNGQYYNTYSVRCVRDENNSSATVPVVTTDSVSKRTDAIAACFGNVVSGGGATVVERGVCWSTSPNPTTADNMSTTLDGLGIFTTFAGGLISDSTYYFRAFATNSVGTGYGNEITFIATRSAGAPCDSMPVVTDIDGNMYNTVKIGNQCWMKENLRVRHYAQNGNSISQMENVSNAGVYGERYTWAQMMGYAQHPGSSSNQSGVQGVCPDGWHLPSQAEWSELANYAGAHHACNNNSSNNAKALAANFGWASSTTTCAVGYQYGTWNATGFSTIPGVDVYIPYSYNEGLNGAFFWSTSLSEDVGYAISFGLKYNYSQTYSPSTEVTNKLSVRCLRNEVRIPEVSTSEMLNYSDTSAVFGGVVEFDNYDSVTVCGIIWSSAPIYYGPSYPTPYGMDLRTASINGGGVGPFAITIDSLSPNQRYNYIAFATNSKGTAYGQLKNFTTACAGIPTVTDYDGNVYHTVKIGNQCWMRENLKTMHYADGEMIHHKSYIYDAADTTAGLFFPNDSLGCVGTYGFLYNWRAAMRNEASSNNNPSQVQGICPNGWHLPSQAEWTQMISYVSSQDEYQCLYYSDRIAKSLAAQSGWNSSSTTCALGNNPTNATGFSALPAGQAYYSNSGSYSWEHTHYNPLGNYAYFLSSTQNGNNFYTLYLYSGTPTVSLNTRSKTTAVSVRCVHGDVQLPGISTNDVSAITDVSAICGGTVGWEGYTSVTERGVCWSTTPHPTITDTHTSDGIGTGSFTSTLTGLSCATTYYVRAYATNSVGTAYGQEVSFTTETNSSTGQSCPGTPTVTDYDGNIYNTVQIGNQCWMKENLRTTRYSDGTGIALGSSTSTTTPYRYYPNNDSSNVSTYGYLYNWSAVMHGASSSSATPSGVQGVCPTGWLVPSDAEWAQLVNHVGSQSQYQCNGSNTKIAKALASTTGWSSSTETCSVGNNPSSNNATGFSAFPAGYYIGGYYGYFGNYAGFWSSSEYDSDNAWKRSLSYDDAGVNRWNYYKITGFSVRCVRDNGGTVSLPTVTTYAVSSITATSATCGGDVTSDGGAAVTARGVCWSDLPNPTVSNSYTTDGIGTGIFTSSLTGLSANTTYYVRSYATNSAGTAYGSEVSFTTETGSSTGQSCPGTPTVTDYDGNTYNTVQIGNQCWMKENLRTTRYSDGTGIALGSSTSTTTPYRYYPNNDSSNVSTYGYLYNWPAVMHGASSSSANPSGVQGICPTGWHVPSDAEWTQLTDYVGSQSQYVCGGNSANIAKSLASTTGWSSSTDACAVGNNPGANNATGFSAFPAGDYDGDYVCFGLYAYFWSSTESSSSGAWERYLYYNGAIVYGYNGNYHKYDGFSVRCVRD